MDLRDYVRILRSNWKLIALSLCLTVGATSFLTLTATPIYRARTTLLVSSPPGETLDSNYTGVLLSQQVVDSYARLVTGRVVTETVVRDLNLAMTAKDLEGRIGATAPSGTVLIYVTADDASPETARQIADGVANAFTTYINEVEKIVSPSRPATRTTVVQAASVPQAPIAPQPVRRVMIGTMLGLFLGASLALGRDRLDTRIKSLESLEGIAGVSNLAVIPRDDSASAHPVVVQARPHAAGAEAFRRLRTNIQFLDVDNTVRSLVVTSAVPEEGKSTTSCNLAAALAQAGMKVILVEGDLRRPKLPDYLGLVGEVGLTNVLVGQLRLTDALQDWQGLFWVLMGGPTPPNPSELLGSEAMAQTIRELVSLADIVVFDAPPLLVTDAAALAANTDGAILVVKSHATRAEQVRAAVAALTGVRARLLGTVINMAPRGPEGYDVGYYRYDAHPDPKSWRRFRPGKRRDATKPPMEPMDGFIEVPRGRAAAADPPVAAQVTPGPPPRPDTSEMPRSGGARAAAAPPTAPHAEPSAPAAAAEDRGERRQGSSVDLHTADLNAAFDDLRRASQALDAPIKSPATPESR